LLDPEVHRLPGHFVTRIEQAAGLTGNGALARFRRGHGVRVHVPHEIEAAVDWAAMNVSRWMVCTRRVEQVVCQQ
jgi:hypothetical protein